MSCFGFPWIYNCCSQDCQVCVSMIFQWFQNHLMTNIRRFWSFHWKRNVFQKCLSVLMGCLQIPFIIKWTFIRSHALSSIYMFLFCCVHNFRSIRIMFTLEVYKHHRWFLSILMKILGFHLAPLIWMNFHDFVRGFVYNISVPIILTLPEGTGTDVGGGVARA